MDVAKFTLVSGAMKHMDLGGGALTCEPLSLISLKGKALRSVLRGGAKELLDLIEDSFNVRGGHVTILPTEAIHRLTWLATTQGLRHPAVEAIANGFFSSRKRESSEMLGDSSCPSSCPSDAA
jgi:hypothetical protein